MIIGSLTLKVFFCSNKIHFLQILSHSRVTSVQLSPFHYQQLRWHRFLNPAAVLTCLHVSGMSVKLWLNSLAGRPPRSTTSTPPWLLSNQHQRVSSFQWPWNTGMNLSRACMWRRGWLQICEMDTNKFQLFPLPALVFRAQREQHLENQSAASPAGLKYL